MAIGPVGGQQVGDIDTFVDRVGVILGHDVHAAEAAAIELDRTSHIFQRRPAGGIKAPAVDDQRAAVDRDGAGFVCMFDTVEFLFAVGKLALDRDAAFQPV